MSELSLGKRSASVAAQVIFVLFCGVVLAFVVTTMPAGISAALVPLLLFGIVFLRRPELGLLAVLLVRSSTDLSLRFKTQVSVGDLPLGALPNILLMSVVIFAGGLAILSRRMRFIGLPGGRMLSLLLLAGLVATVNAESKLLAVSDWLPISASFVIYSLAAHLFDTPQAVRRVIDVTYLSFVVPSSVGLYQLLRGEGVFVPGLSWPRIYGTFVHPNAFGFYLVVMFAIFITQLLSQQGIHRRLALTGVVVSTVLLLATFARVVWLGATIVVLTVGLFRHRILLIVLPVLAVLLVGLVSPVAERLAHPFGGSFSDRFANLWPAVLYEWAQTTASEKSTFVVLIKRLVGLGPGMGLILGERGYGLSTPPHNDYLRVLVEYGIIGLVVFVLLLVTLWIFAYRTWRIASRAHPQASGISLAFLAVSAAFPIMSLTDNVFGYTANQAYFWTLAGLAVTVRRFSEGSGAGLAVR